MAVVADHGVHILRDGVHVIKTVNAAGDEVENEDGYKISCLDHKVKSFRVSVPYHTTGKQAYFCGKPNPLMMRTGLNILGCHSAEAVMIGDRMDTDIISGMECGMSTVLVLSGVSNRDTIETFAYRPTIVLDGVGDIVKLAETQTK